MCYPGHRFPCLRSTRSGRQRSPLERGRSSPRAFARSTIATPFLIAFVSIAVALNLLEDQITHNFTGEALAALQLNLWRCSIKLSFDFNRSATGQSHWLRWEFNYRHVTVEDFLYISQLLQGDWLSCPKDVLLLPLLCFLLGRCLPISVVSVVAKNHNNNYRRVNCNTVTSPDQYQMTTKK